MIKKTKVIQSSRIKEEDLKKGAEWCNYIIDYFVKYGKLPIVERGVNKNEK